VDLDAIAATISGLYFDEELQDDEDPLELDLVFDRLYDEGYLANKKGIEAAEKLLEHLARLSYGDEAEEEEDDYIPTKMLDTLNGYRQTVHEVCTTLISQFEKDMT